MAIDEGRKARELVMELMELTAPCLVDPVPLGIVLRDGEIAWRQVDVGVATRTNGSWSPPLDAAASITSQRLLIRHGNGELSSWWWNGVDGFLLEPDARRVILDYGDRCPRAVSGPSTMLVAVAAVWALYGADALLRHPALDCLREIRRSES